jgi:hypothetical protein
LEVPELEVPISEEAGIHAVEASKMVIESVTVRVKSWERF